MSNLLRRRRAIVALLAGAAFTVGGGAAVAGSATTTLPNGAELTVSVTSPVTSNEYVIPAGQATRSVNVQGTASVGLGEPNATFIYVIDVSGSTGGGSGTGCAPILQCEQKFVVALNNAVIANGSVDEVGVVVFGTGAASADVSPTAGSQPLTQPNAGPGNITTVVNSTTSSGTVGQFTPRSVGGGFTNYAAALQAALPLVQAATNDFVTIVFLSDGESNEGGGAFDAALSAIAAEGAVIQSVAVGSSSSCTGGTDGTLQQMATATGGVCRAIADPGALPNIIPDLLSSSLDALTLSIDGGAAVPIPNSAIDPDLPHAGPVSVAYSTAAAGLGPGDHTLCVTATGHDAAGSKSVTRCETIHVFGLTLAPPNAINELGTAGQTHTVTATLAGPNTAASSNVNRSIAFSVLSGPNAGASGTGTTDATGHATFTYTATQGLAGLGTDVIQACFTSRPPIGETVCVTVTKTWRDTTAPAVACRPTTNPSGGNVPRAGTNPASGQNPDGYYVLRVADAVDPNPTIMIDDTESSATFGAFADGTTIKLVQAPGATPSQKPGAGVIDWKITLKGDARLIATDASGNTSTVTCRVPPPPK